VALRLQSGVAMADGSWGVGRDPGRGFALIDRHASLNDAEILVSIGAGERPAARADRLGPAVVPLTAAYRPQNLRIGARNLEPGYSIGAGVYTVLPGALNGVRIEIGNAAYRTAVATLIGEDGAPAALRFGRLVNLETGAETSIFTNRTGRAAFNALSPGRYQARLQGGGVFSFQITEDAPAYVSMGVLNAETPDG
jgi:outer membrane usher protein FimD/PapC